MTEYPNWFAMTAQANFETYVPDVPNMKVLQVGVYTGDATQWLLDNRDIKAIVDVDTWKGSDESAHESMDFSKVEEYYDSRFASNDKVNAFRHLKSGGVIAFDDYTWQSGKGEFYDPQPAIKAFYHIVKTQVTKLAENSQVWLRRN